MWASDRDTQPHLLLNQGILMMTVMIMSCKGQGWGDCAGANMDVGLTVSLTVEFFGSPSRASV